MAGRLVVFDLDGTLIDSRLDLATAVNQVLAGKGARPLSVDRVTAMVGEGARVLLDRAFAAAGLPTAGEADLDAFNEAYDEHLVETTTTYPGVGALLEHLSHMAALALVTNKPSRPTRRLLAHFGLDRFFSDVCGGDTPLGRKPSPAAVLQLMQTTGSAPPATLIVGDSRVDLATARAAGVRFCLARYGFGSAGMDASDLAAGDWIIDSPLDLLPLATGADTGPTTVGQHTGRRPSGRDDGRSTHATSPKRAQQR
jgi:phosphoglycolate phosphatase